MKKYSLTIRLLLDKKCKKKLRARTVAEYGGRTKKKFERKRSRIMKKTGVHTQTRRDRKKVAERETVGQREIVTKQPFQY